MSMSIAELERALRSLRLSGMTATLQARALQVTSHEMDFVEAFSWLVQDELDRRRSRLLDRRHTLSGLPERKDFKDFDWSYNPRLPKRDVLELATLKFVDAREDVLFATCRLQGVDPYTYLVDVLQRIDCHPQSQVHQLTPRLWKQHFADAPLRSLLDRAPP